MFRTGQFTAILFDVDASRATSRCVVARLWGAEVVEEATAILHLAPLVAEATAILHLDALTAGAEQETGDAIGHCRRHRCRHRLSVLGPLAYVR
jgi:hypothetical protein